ncbi:MAG: FtsH protease activity modulator HflK [Deltaproteobacteria bacterium]|nr:FtsH protease activity modulator HflK [Deltaproteobacteria bacterium]
MMAWKDDEFIRGSEGQGYGGPSMEEVLGNVQEKIRRWGGKRVLFILLAIIIGIWLASGTYMVGPGEMGVVRQFGKIVDQTDPGLRYRFPWPIQTHDVVHLARVRRAEVGLRTDPYTGKVRPEPKEALMLTGDENIVDAQLFVQYVVKDPSLFLFRVRSAEAVLKSSAEVALRSVVGRNTIDFTMTEGRVIVQDEVKKYLQSLLDEYQTGLMVTEARLLVVDPPEEVKDAFHDVVRAWEDRERVMREAEGYREDLIPKAKGEAVQMLRAAEAYKEQRVIRAQGDAGKFLDVLRAYRKGKEVTRERLYLETLEKILPGKEKYILPPEGGNSVLKWLPLKDGVTLKEKEGKIKEKEGKKE